MTQTPQRNNPYLQNRFEDNEQPITPRRAGGGGVRQRGEGGMMLRERLMQKFTANPVLAATTLLLAGAAFATIIMVSYPNGNETTDIPTIQADAEPFRELTTETASAQNTNQDSTIYSTLRSDTLKETPPIENLLEQEEPVERPAPTEASNTKAETTTTTMAAATTPATQTTTTSTPAPATTAKTVEATPPAMPPEATTASATTTTTTTTTSADAVPLQHAAGESPDTLAFVQSVLDKKDGRGVSDATATQATPGPTLNEVTPSSGGTFAPGTYYVQLGSVTSRGGADTEFKKMQKNFAGTGLESASYRVQEATVADKGTFYRIQAGPMNKESAGKLCDSIKAKSPGGCLIVQQ